MYFILILAIHSMLCIALIGLVLLQQGKGADAGATFGGGGNTVFGAAGATDFITKLTTSLAIGFMITSILLIRAYQGGGGAIFTQEAPDVLGGSVMGEVVAEQEKVAEQESSSQAATGAAPETAPVTKDNTVAAEDVAQKEAPALPAEGAAEAKEGQAAAPAAQVVKEEAEAAPVVVEDTVGNPTKSETAPAQAGAATASSSKQ